MDVKRFQNYGLWAAVIGLIPLVLPWFGIYDMPANYKEVAGGVLGILVLAGIINNPSIGPGYSDDEI